MVAFGENATRPKILVVDDQEPLRILLAECLHDLEVDIEEADSGEVALKKLTEDDYSLIILDIQMPRMDGFEVLEHIRNDLKLDDIPVVFVSAVFDQETYIIKGIEKGAIDFVSKPINQQIFRRKVINFLKLYEKQAKLDQLVKQLGHTNKQLKENEIKFKRITQSANDSIILLDSVYNIRFWNKASKEIFGYVKYEIVSENFFEKIIPEKSHAFLRDKFEILNKTSQSALSNSFRLTGIKKVGLEFPIELSLGRFETIDHKIQYTVIIRDITHRVKMEKEMLKSKELRESNKIMKEFMDNVSHELRTPMNAILGISNMLLKYNADNLKPKQIEGLQIINQSGTRLLDLINDVLDVSRIESGRMTIKNEKLDLEKYLASLRSIVISLIGEKKIRFFIRKSANVSSMILVDQEKLNQILMNLLGNAVKFTQEGSVHLFIHRIDEKLFFEVTDTGIGMENENISIIFDRFRQIDNSSSKQYKGTGLGLHICKRLIEMLNGEIKVESSPGAGTTMKFYITTQPVPEESKTGDKVRSPRTIITEHIDGPNAPLVIIIDNAENAFRYNKLCSNNGFNVIHCEDSIHIYEIIHQFLPQLIILRYEMPKIHGHFILNRIRESSHTEKTPVFVISEIEGLKLSTNHNLVTMFNEPVEESILQESLVKLLPLEINRVEVDQIILFEKKDNFKHLITSDDEHYQVASFEMAKLIIIRRKIKHLVLDGLEVDGINSKLVEWFNDNMKYGPEKLLIVTSEKLFKFQLDNIKKLPFATHAQLQTILEKESLSKAFNI